jgi:hypothetical protein
MLASDVAIRKNLEKMLKHVSSAFERLQAINQIRRDTD